MTEDWGKTCLRCKEPTRDTASFYCAQCRQDFRDAEARTMTGGGPVTDGPITVRTFATGANRDTAVGKPDYDGYLHPLTVKRFGEYMLKHQVLKDGTIRSSSNWTGGMPRAVYTKSLVRHVEDVRRHVRGFPEAAVESVEEALCAVIFNAQGLLLEVLLGRDVKEDT